ncbi:hypothetical protein [Aquamicrobium sp. LC103]|nr:hypothetical protein [Aquamicrobium sp. LC103]
MDDSVQKSCWGLTVKAVIAIGCVILLAWLFNVPAETGAILAAG